MTDEKIGLGMLVLIGVLIVLAIYFLFWKDRPQLWWKWQCIGCQYTECEGPVSPDAIPPPGRTCPICGGLMVIVETSSMNPCVRDNIA